MHQQQYYVYILTNQNKTVLYTGVTNNLQERIYNTIKTGKQTTLSLVNMRLTTYSSTKDTNTSTTPLQEKKKSKVGQGKRNGV